MGLNPESTPNFVEKLNHERLSDEELGGLVSAIGTSESKAMLLACMSQRPTEILTSNSLNKLVHFAQDIPFPSKGYDGPGWATNANALENYCRKSFIPMGFVAEELVDSHRNKYGFMVKPYGRDKGLPLAGLLLDYSQRHGIALRDIFGDAYSSSHIDQIVPDSNDGITNVRKRAPLTRIKILRFLVQNFSPIQEDSLSIALEEEDINLIYRHINSLSEKGIISGAGIEGKRDIGLNDEQRQKASELIDILNKFQNKDPNILSKGKSLALSFVNNKEKAVSAMQRAKESSPLAERVSQEEVISNINYIVSSNPGINAPRIRKELENTFDIKLSLDRIRDILSVQCREGNLSRRRTERGSYLYNLN